MGLADFNINQENSTENMPMNPSTSRDYQSGSLCRIFDSHEEVIKTNFSIYHNFY